MTAAQALLERRRAVAPLDVVEAIGWLPASAADRWRRGTAACLEQVTAVGPGRLADLLEIVHRWAGGAGLPATEITYPAATRDRVPLRFTEAGAAETERAWCTQWTSPQLSEAARQRLVDRRGAAPDLVVVQAVSAWTCAECAETGDMLIVEAGQPLCLTCADLDQLVFLPAGDAALTRRARKASTLAAVVVRFQRSRKRYQRQGILVEPAALEAAEQQCLSDADARERRRIRDAERRAGQDVALVAGMTDEIVRLFPGCPPRRAAAIAAHASVRGSGRVGRSAAGRALADDAVVRAVVASVRHLDTDYDELLMAGVARTEARERIRDAIDRVLAGWRAG